MGETSFELEKKQIKKELAEKENLNIINSNIDSTNFYYPEKVVNKLKKLNNNLKKDNTVKKFNVGIIRDEGSNGDREMLAALEMAGLIFNICMNDLLDDNNILNNMRGLVFVGGFSYADVLVLLMDGLMLLKII